jgi:hypothetical protein
VRPTKEKRRAMRPFSKEKKIYKNKKIKRR